MNPYQIPFWKEAPFVRIVMVFIVGIIVQSQCSFSIVTIAIFTCIIFLFYFLFYFLPLSLRYRWRFIQGVMTLNLILGFSMMMTWQNDLRNHNQWYGNRISEGNLMELRILEPFQEKNKTFKTFACLQNVKDNSSLKNTKGSILLYIKKSKKSDSLKYGNILLTHALPQKITNALNPGDFDYAKYLSQQQIYHQLFLKDSDYVILQPKQESFIMKLVFNLREYVLNILKQKISDKKIRGIAEALLIGYKNNLDQELVQSYSNTGVVHIIAISGMHLGLIYVVLLWLFGKLPFIRKQKLLKFGSVLLCLWIFSLITGASASVLRSAVMFSCIIMGELLQKKSNIYNSLAVSAFLLLCYNPLFIFEVGFQLSYLAILGIVIFQKPIEHLFEPKSFLLRKLNEMVSITIAAQIMTFPICLYYFHQFPVLFLITNLIAVPLSTFILFAEIGLIAFHSIVGVGYGLKIIVEQSISFLNEIISIIDTLPYSSIKNLYANGFTTFIVYLLVICFILLFQNKNRIYIRAIFLLSIFFSSFQAFAKFKIQHQKKIIIYNLNHHQSVCFINGENYFIIGDTLPNLKNTIQYYHLKSRIDNMKDLNYYYPFVIYLNTKMMIVDADVKYRELKDKVKVDMLLISNNAKVKMSDLIKSVSPRTVLIDGSNKKWKSEFWKKECDSLGINCIQTAKSGYYEYNVH